MEKTSLRSIKWENTRAVFSVIADRPNAEIPISRAEIAARTALSLMTAGKVTDALLERRAIVQTKEEHSAAGRRSRLVACHPARFFIILTLRAHEVQVTFFDLCMRPLDDYIYACENNLDYAANLVLFLKNLPLCLPGDRTMADCLGAGVLLPDAYDSAADRVMEGHLPELAGPGLRVLLERHLSVPRLHIEESVRAAARAAANLSDEEAPVCRLLLSLGRPVSGALLLGSVPLEGAHNCAGRLGRLCVGTGLTLDDALDADTEPEQTARYVAEALYSLIAVLDPAEILLESNRFALDEDFLTLLHEQLARRAHADSSALTIPPLIANPGLPGYAQRGMTLWLRDTWLNSLID